LSKNSPYFKIWPHICFCQTISYHPYISNECWLGGPRASDGPLVSGHGSFWAGLLVLDHHDKFWFWGLLLWNWHLVSIISWSKLTLFVAMIPYLMLPDYFISSIFLPWMLIGCSCGASDGPLVSGHDNDIFELCPKLHPLDGNSGPKLTLSGGLRTYLLPWVLNIDIICS
jgi:hypothetical protein